MVSAQIHGNLPDTLQPIATWFSERTGTLWKWIFIPDFVRTASSRWPFAQLNKVRSTRLRKSKVLQRSAFLHSIWPLRPESWQRLRSSSWNRRCHPHIQDVQTTIFSSFPWSTKWKLVPHTYRSIRLMPGWQKAFGLFWKRDKIKTATEIPGRLRMPKYSRQPAICETVPCRR